MHELPSTTEPLDDRPWYAGVTAYEWLVLIIACAGWVFDQYESQIFVVTKNNLLAAMPQVHGEIKRWTDNLFGVFLLGSTVGGLFAGSLADRYGRRPLLIATILVYSLSSGLTYFVTDLWQLIAVRFLVAMGVGGEWAVAASLVAEVFPARARPHASGIFHASSILGIWLATLAGLAVAENWRYAYLFGILPALLILWVRAKVQEPEQWREKAALARASRSADAQLGSFRALLTTSPWSRRALFGVLLGAVGLGTFWSVIVAGQDLAKEQLLRDGASVQQADSGAKFAYGIVQTTGAGLGLLSFGPISARIGRRRAFIAFQVLALAIVPITCFAPHNYSQLIVLLPIFGFLTIAIHAGFAIYFPELFPTSLREPDPAFASTVAASSQYRSYSCPAG